MKSLEELNQYALSPITYIDDRPARVFFDRGATVDQFVEVNENTTYFFPYGIDIDDITQFDVALVEYEIDLTSFTSNAVYLSWPNSITLPAYITVSRVGNYFTISGIRSASDWDLVKAVRVQPPFSVSGFKPQVGKITWFENAQATTRTEARWDVQLSLVPVEYFGPAALELYTSNLQDQQIAAPQIIVDPDEFDPEWTLEISPSVLSAVTLIYSTNPSEAETSWNPTTKTFSITGDQTAVNNTLQDLEVDYARSDADFTFQYLLRNNFNLITESQIQFVESRDFISDFDLLISSSTFPSVIYGGVSNMSPFVTFDDVDYDRFRDPGATNAAIIATSNIEGNGIFRTSVSMSSSFEQEPILNFELEIESTLTCDAWAGEAIEYELGVTQFTPILFNLVEPAAGQYLQLVSDNGDDVYWAAGTSKPALNGATAGSYIYKITGYADADGINWQNIYDQDYTIDILGFGGDVSTKMSIGFANNVTSFPDRLHPNFRDISNMFNGSGSRLSSFYAPVANWNTSNITNMSYMFSGATNFDTDITGWNTSSVTNMAGMFNNADSFNQDISGWNVSNVTNMFRMFAFNNIFNQSLSAWDTGNVSNFGEMFLSAIAFNGDLSGWDLSSTTSGSFSRMFSGSAFNNNSLNSWTFPASVTSLNSMFENATSFNQDISGWDVSNITLMGSMFKGASAFNQSLNSWDTSNVTFMAQMFRNAASFNGAIGNWDVSNVTDFSRMFEGATGFNQNINDWDIREAQDISYMFRNATSYNQPMEAWYPQSIPNNTYISYFLSGATAYNQDLSFWCVPNFTSTPTEFAPSLSAGQLPVWGTCPFTGTISGEDFSYVFTDPNGINWKTYIFHNSNTGSNARTATISGAQGYAQLIITAAGGHGGGDRATDSGGGGGGGGGVATNALENTFAKITDGTYNFTIGQADTSYIEGNTGGATTAFGYTVPGGGNGGSYGFDSSPQYQLGSDGANGGGAASEPYGVDTRGESVSTGYIDGGLGLTPYLNAFDGKTEGTSNLVVGVNSFQLLYSGGGASGTASNQNIRGYNSVTSNVYSLNTTPTSGVLGPYGGEGIKIETIDGSTSNTDHYGSGGGGSIVVSGTDLNFSTIPYGGYKAGNGAYEVNPSVNWIAATDGTDGYGGGGGGGIGAQGAGAGRGGCGSVVIRVQQ
jgi:surface protein